MKKTIISVGLSLAGAVAAAGVKDIELPPCGMLVGHAVYNYQGLYPGGYGNWLVQHGSPFDLIERTVKEEQGNLIQFWFWNGNRPLTKAAWLDMEELGFKCPKPDWKNLKNLRCDEFPDFAKYEQERAGAGVLRAIRMCETNGLYSQLMYVGGVNEKYTQEFTKSKSYVGYDFGERFTFRSENGGNADQAAPRLDKLADNLVASVRKHCEEYRAKGYGNVWCTSSNFFLDYEVYGGVDYTLFEDFTCDLNIPSALSRGLARQYGRKLWGGHVANEYYAWITSKNPHFYRMLFSAFACKYVAGAKVLVSESGGWHTQTPGSDSPLNDLPKSRVSFTAKTPSDAELAPIALEAERLRDLASEEGHWSRSFRQALGDFYRYVKKHGTPEGQPESTFAIAKGNYDLEGGMLDGRPKPNSVIAGLHPYAEKHMEWMAGAPEFGWGIAGEVFWPRGQGIFGSKDVNRIFSGTPWGQVDIVSFAYDNVTAEHLLKNYKTLAFVGWNTCSKQQYKILCDYVKGGGRLLISIPQLSTDLTRNYQAYTKDDLVNGGDFTELCGIKVVDRGPYFYWTGAVKGSSAERWSSARTHGAYRGILGKVEVSNPQAEPLIYNWENDMNVLYRLPSGKGEVWFLNSWYYPGAYNFSYGTGVGPNSLGFVEDILKEMARRSRGTAYLTEKGADDPGDECKFVNWSYFPSTKEVILFNVDFEKAHTVDLHFSGKVKTLALPPNELVREKLWNADSQKEVGEWSSRFSVCH